MTCNIFIIGKTGAGKSSLLNFMANDNSAANAGIGSSVGGVTKGFSQPKNISFEGLDCVCIDSEGYEISAIKDWENMINDKIKDCLKSPNPEEGFPVVLYCIDGAGGRVTDYDFDTIEMLSSLKLGVVPVITKANLCSNEEITEICDIISSRYNNILSVPLDSISKELMESDRHNLRNAILEGWSFSVTNRFADYIYDSELDDFYTWECKMRKWIRNQDTGLFGAGKGEMTDYLSKELEVKVKDMSKQIRMRADNTVKTILEINKQFSGDKFSSIPLSGLEQLAARSQNLSSSSATAKIWDNVGTGVFNAFAVAGFFLLPFLGAIGAIAGFILNQVSLNSKVKKKVDNEFKTKVAEIAKEFYEQKFELSHCFERSYYLENS